MVSSSDAIGVAKVIMLFLIAFVPLAPCRLVGVVMQSLALQALAVASVALGLYADLLLGWVMAALFVAIAVRYRHRDCAPTRTTTPAAAPK
jgi:hypothetical protein